MSANAIHAAEQRCLRLVTLAENQAKEQRKTLQGEIKRLQGEVAEKEEEALNATKQSSRALQLYSQQLADAVKLFETRHRDFTGIIHHVGTLRAEQESAAVAKMKDAVSHFYQELRGTRKGKFLKTLKALHLGSQLQQSTLAAVEDEEDVPFSMQAVMQYLVGAVEALERQSQQITTEVRSQLEREAINRRGYLLDEERKIFQTKMRKLTSPFVSVTHDGSLPASPSGSPGGPSTPGSPGGRGGSSAGSGTGSGAGATATDLDLISPQALEVILCQKLVEAKEIRHQACLDLMGQSMQSQTKTLTDAIVTADQKMTDVVVALTHSPLEVATRSGGTAAHVPGIMDSPAGKRSRWGKLKVKMDDVIEQKNPLGQQHTGAGGLANLVSSLISNKRGHLPPSTLTGYSGGGDHTGVTSIETPMGNFVYAVNNMEDQVISKVVEQHVEDYATIHGEYSQQMEQLARRCFESKEVQFYQTTTVFSLDSLKAELEHRELVSRVMVDQEQQLREKFEQELRRLDEVVVNLQNDNSKLRRDIAELNNQLETKETEIETLQTVVLEKQHLSGTQMQLKRDIRVVQYEVNDKSFGESWQESLLKLRERIISELQNDNLRFIARVNTLVKRQMGDENQLEQLYEARTQSALKELEEDNKRRIKVLTDRHRAEIRHLDDFWKSRMEDVRSECDAEVAASRIEFRQRYQEDCDNLNRMYDERLRKLHCDREEHEEYFARKIVELRQSTRDKEVEIDSRAAKRFAEMNAHFEQLSDDLRNRYSEREKQLDRERLMVQANFESKVNDKVIQIRSDMDVLRQKLEDTVLNFITQQRRSFEQYREKEMTNFSQFSQITDRLISKRQADSLREQTEVHEASIIQMREQHAQELALVRRQQENLRQSQTQDFGKRLNDMKENQEEVLRVTQDLRIEQDESFWNECHNEVIAANRLLLEEKTRLETLLQNRYGNLIEKCQEYLQNDIKGARAAFENEQKVRIAHFHNYCIYYHQIQLKLEQSLWTEQADRHFIEKEYSSETFSLRVRFAEEKRNLAFCEMLDENPFAPIGVITVDELRVIREDYEGRLLDKQRLVSNVTKDSISGLEAHMRSSHNHIVTMENGFTERIENIAHSLQEKFKAYYTARTFLVEDEIRRVAEFAEQVVTNAIKGSSAIVKGSSNVVVVGGDGSPGGPGGKHGGAHWSEDVRVMEYFVSMKQILSQAMIEYEDKLNDRFEDSERQKRDTFHRMHVEYLNASGHLMKELEKLKVHNDFAEISLQQAKTRLTLQSNEHNKARLLCDDLISLLEANNNSKLLRVKGLALANAQGVNIAQVIQGNKLNNPANLIQKGHELDVVVPLSTLGDLAGLRERLYCDEYTTYAKGQVISSLEQEAAERAKQRQLAKTSDGKAVRPLGM